MSGRRISASVARLAPSLPHDHLSAPVLHILTVTAEGRNPHVQFPFAQILLPRGYVAHPPHTDLLEIRPSVTVEFRGTPRGTLMVHMFHDGTIRTREQMHAENNARVQEDARLTAEEAVFQALAQTAARKQAYNRMILRIQALRTDITRSIIAKEIEKSNVIREYRSFLDVQAQARRIAAAQAAQAA